MPVNKYFSFELLTTVIQAELAVALWGLHVIPKIAGD